MMRRTQTQKYLPVSILISVISLLMIYQPIFGEESPHLLLVDFSQSHETSVQPLLSQLTAAGYQCDYRPYYPGLVKKDFRTYQTMIIALGKDRALGYAWLTQEAKDLLRSYICSGHSVLFSVSLSGTYHAWMLNMLMEELDIPIRVQYQTTVFDHEHRYKGSIVDGPLVQAGHPDLLDAPTDSLALGLSPALEVRPPAIPLIKSYETAFQFYSWQPLQGEKQEQAVFQEYPIAALARIPTSNPERTHSWVAVMGRYPLFYGDDTSLLRPLSDRESESRALEFMEEFIHSFAEWDQHPETFPIEYIEPMEQDSDDQSIENAANPEPFLPVEKPDAIDEADYPEIPLLDELPERVRVIHGQAAYLSQDFHTRVQQYTQLANPDRYGRYVDEGIRGAWGYINQTWAHLEELTARLAQSGLNIYWGPANPHNLFNERNSILQNHELMNKWDYVAERLENTPCDWFIGYQYPNLGADRSSYPHMFTAGGMEISAPSLVDESYWVTQMYPPAELMAEYAVDHSAVTGIFMDMEMYGFEYIHLINSLDFSDLAYSYFLENWAEAHLDNRELRHITYISQAERYTTLMNHGLLEAYYQTLEHKAERIGQQYRARIQAIDPDLVLGFYAMRLMNDWFYRGFWRGCSDPEHPVLLFTFSKHSDRQLSHYIDDEIYALHAEALLMGQFDMHEFPERIQDSYVWNHGYWLNRISTTVVDSQGGDIETPRGGTMEEAWELLKQGNLE